MYEEEVLENSLDSILNGWQKLDSVWYYFRNGSMTTSWVMDKVKWYYQSSSGVIQTGWVKP